MLSFSIGGFFVITIICTKYFYHYIKKTYQEKNIDKYNVYIVRGLKGSGKSSWIKNNEERLEESYPLIYNNSDYIECDIFDTINSNNIKKHDYLKSYTKCINRLVTQLRNNRHRIYITAPFPESWEYSNFVFISEQYGYNLVFIEIDCDDETQAKYFQFRSPNKKIPYINNVYAFKNLWKNDKRFIKICPEISECDGDSIPKQNITKEQLDADLENYFKR